MSRVVIDASAALAWLQDEARPAWVDGLLDDSQNGRSSLQTPPLFWLETGNTLSLNHELTDDQILDGMMRLEALGIETVDLSRPLRLHALQLARQEGLTVYDATYLAAAAALGAPLATLDRQLDAAAASLGLSFSGVPRGLSETPAPYGREPDPVSVAAIGATLAELRSQYLSEFEEPS